MNKYLNDNLILGDSLGNFLGWIMLAKGSGVKIKWATMSFPDQKETKLESTNALEVQSQIHRRDYRYINSR